jgi:hypothetical protein
MRPIAKSRRRGVAGYDSRCPASKSETIGFICALFLVKITSQPTKYYHQSSFYRINREAMPTSVRPGRPG